MNARHKSYVEYVGQFFKTNARGPTYDELAEHFHETRASAYQCVFYLSLRGKLRRVWNRATPNSEIMDKAPLKASRADRGLVAETISKLEDAAKICKATGLVNIAASLDSLRRRWARAAKGTGEGQEQR